MAARLTQAASHAFARQKPRRKEASVRHGYALLVNLSAHQSELKGAVAGVGAGVHAEPAFAGAGVRQTNRFVDHGRAHPCATFLHDGQGANRARRTNLPAKVALRTAAGPVTRRVRRPQTRRPVLKCGRPQDPRRADLNAFAASDA
jgi:hypothetical protein